MNKIGDGALHSELNEQGANNLLSATFGFLQRNNISKKSILDFTKKYDTSHKSCANSRQYRELQSRHEKMGVLMAAWFSESEFLDASGHPIPLTKGKGPNSLAHLIRISRARIQQSIALKLMRQSPSVKFESDGRMKALRRVFVLPELEVPRAAFVIERFLETLQNNAVSRRKNATLLLERSCHVSEVDLSLIAPLLRDIEGGGTAFMNSIDGEIEDQRLRRERRKPIGEMGVLVFAWTKPADSTLKNKKCGLKAAGSRKLRPPKKSA